MEKLKNIWTNVKPVQILPVGFLAIILTGAILLMLPISIKDGNGSLSFLQALFTATSATCVTGLVVVDTGTYFTTFGQLVIILMIQFGGLGFMTVATFLFIAMGKRISLKERMTMAESLGESRLQGIIKLAVNVLKTTFILEFAGAALLSIRFIPIYGLAKGVWYSVFHSISAFCNAGFDLIGNYASFTAYVGDPIINITIMLLIMIGGIGFAVIGDVLHKRSFVNFRFHTKIVLIMTAVLIFGGALLFFIFEYNNPQTLAVLDFPEKIFASLFQSVTTRTAGFNTISQIGMTDASKLLSVILMFIGGSPAGTAGGVKTSTVAVLVMVVVSLMRRHDDVEAFKKRISANVLRKSLAIFFMALTALIIAVMIISTNEEGTVVGELGFLNQLFEATSAIGTVGLSSGVTGSASSITLIVLIVLMFLGRVGLLTVLFALSSKAEESHIKYQEEDVLVG